MTTTNLWDRYRSHLCIVEALDLRVDVSRMHFPAGFMDRMATPMAHAFEAMATLEKGAIANPDEDRMVGHYWLRAPELAPRPALSSAIIETRERIADFARDVHAGTIRPQRADRFEHVLVIGIGGSALGPQFVADALATRDDPMRAHFFDNTDPDGMARVIARLGEALERTLTVVISKSGGTAETRNGMLFARRAYERAGLDFARHAVAITGDGSDLDRTASAAGWLERFPMWDWVGGRASVLAAVGLLPAALQGFDVDALLDGAREMDVATRRHEVASNPAALLALMWHHAGDGRGTKDMVVLPYSDRLLLFSRYLQQLVMESLGKERDLDGNVVHQGMSVYGNKGSTDQHAYVQQLRDGVNNFFVTFIHVLHDGDGDPLEVEPDVRIGDYLTGFLLGTRAALFDADRESITITVPDVHERSIGALIALYERAVGLYATLVGVNAYDQPGVEAGKRAAGSVLELQKALLDALRADPAPRSAAELARAAGRPDHIEQSWTILEHLAANGRLERSGSGPDGARYRVS
ncbi:glucose-6-phosphate isomerase [soil metagenome]